MILHEFDDAWSFLKPLDSIVFFVSWAKLATIDQVLASAAPNFCHYLIYSFWF